MSRVNVRHPPCVLLTDPLFQMSEIFPPERPADILGPESALHQEAIHLILLLAVPGSPVISLPAQKFPNLIRLGNLVLLRKAPVDQIPVNPLALKIPADTQAASALLGGPDKISRETFIIDVMEGRHIGISAVSPEAEPSSDPSSPECASLSFWLSGSALPRESAGTVPGTGLSLPLCQIVSVPFHRAQGLPPPGDRPCNVLWFPVSTL